MYQWSLLSFQVKTAPAESNKSLMYSSETRWNWLLVVCWTSEAQGLNSIKTNSKPFKIKRALGTNMCCAYLLRYKYVQVHFDILLFCNFEITVFPSNKEFNQVYTWIIMFIRLWTLWTVWCCEGTGGASCSLSGNLKKSSSHHFLSSSSSCDWCDANSVSIAVLKTHNVHCSKK